jgi:hypothetical protein
MTLNPITHARRLAGYIAEDPQGGDAPPERWDDTSTTSNALGFLKRHPWLFVAGAFFLVALLLFFVPVLPTAHYNGWTLAAGVFVASNAVTAYTFRKKGMQAWQDYDLNVLFTGRGIVPRVGKWDGDIDDRLKAFKILKQVGPSGLRTAFEQFRDVYSRREIERHKDKYHRVDTDGTGDVRHGVLKNTTFEVDTCKHDIDVFGSISVSHIGQPEERLDAKEYETAGTIAPVIDVRTSDKIDKAFRAEATARRHSDQELAIVSQQLDKLEEHVDPAGQPLFERTMELLNEEKDRREAAQQRSNAATNGTGGDH